MPWERELDLARTIAREAGALLRRLAGERIEVLSDEGKDIKLRADRQSEALILERLAAASPYPVLSEETGEHGALERGPFWVVDPLDGTVNFSRGMPLACVSIALVEGDESRVGCIYDFYHDELFEAATGECARLNGRPIRVSGVSEPSRAILSTGFPSYRDYGQAALLEFVGRVQQFKKVRQVGAAAISLAWVACGRIDAYGEDDAMLWDVAAGVVLVREAGGWVDLRPSPRHRWGRCIRTGAAEALWR